MNHWSSLKLLSPRVLKAQFRYTFDFDYFPPNFSSWKFGSAAYSNRLQIGWNVLMDAVMQKVLFGEPPCDETEATTALFYSITSTQVMLYFLLSCHEFILYRPRIFF